MTRAYKCDSCDEFGEGDPLKVAVYASETPTFDPVTDEVVVVELCERCKDDVVRDITLRVNND